MLKFFSVVGLIVASIAIGVNSCDAASVAFEAESGMLGSDFTNGVDGAVHFISISTDTVNNGNPGNANRMATYTVVFPEAGTYDLYAHIYVGAETFDDDSMFYGNGFGIKSATSDNDWILVNGLAGGGFTTSTDIVLGNGSAGSQSWKWMNLSQFNPSGSGTETPITFTVPSGNLTQTFQVGGRENGLNIDKFVFGMDGYTFTVSNLDNGTDGTPPPSPDCTITWTNQQQHIDGFGFSSAWCGRLTSAKNNALYNTLGMSILRVRIDETGAWSQEIANAAAAHAAGATVLGSPWSAPVAWTSNGSNSMGYLLPEHYADYANWLSNAAVSMNLDYVSIQNEPDYSAWMNWTAAQIFDFMKTNAPAIGKPVVMPESYHFNDAYSDPVINDPATVTNFAILGGHFYGGGNYMHTNAIAHGKPVWMTEHYLDGGTTNFAVCLNWAKEINDAMNNQFNAYIAWWAQDDDTNINLANSSGTIFKDGYTLGQFAKFIRPGYYRIGATNTISSAQISAYKDLESSNYIIVALNPRNTVITQQFNFNGFPAMAATPSLTAWITSYSQSLEAQSPITNFGSTFTYSIQPSNIVTFVGTPLVATPTDLSATAGINKVNLNWNPVTGATGYNIKRATASGGPYATVARDINGTSFSDTGLSAETTYYYVVSAFIGGGQSFDSSEAVATTPTVYTLLPVADSYVESGGNANVNFGASTNLLVKNNITIATRNTYLMFDVHALTNAQSATLTLIPNRVDDMTVKMYYELASTNWAENGITWNNQPGGTGIFFATNTVAVGVPTILDMTSAVVNAATNGGLLSIRITQPANTLNGLIEFCSKESTSHALRPVLTYVLPANTPPTLTVIANQTIGVGVTLNITNSATDSDVPAQTLTFNLLTSPTNATIDAGNGLITWRPLVTQANSTNPFTVMATDDGTPALSATQHFVVAVTNFVPPQLLMVSSSADRLVFQVNGANGPDYQIQSSTNLTDWSAILTTNSPPMPFIWTNNDISLPVNFFRVLVGPPFQ